MTSVFAEVIDDLVHQAVPRQHFRIIAWCREVPDGGSVLGSRLDPILGDEERFLLLRTLSMFLLRMFLIHPRSDVHISGLHVVLEDDQAACLHLRERC